MKKVFALLFVFVLSVNGVFAADEWGDINAESADNLSLDSGSSVENDSVDLDEPNESDGFDDSGFDDDYVDDDYVAPDFDARPGVGSREGGEFYKTEFYVALGFAVLVLVIIGFFIWMWFRGPKNKWD
jgi:hypothetical protein